LIPDLRDTAMCGRAAILAGHAPRVARHRGVAQLQVEARQRQYGKILQNGKATERLHDNTCKYGRTAEHQCRRTAYSAAIRRDGNAMERLHRRTAATIQWMAGPWSWRGRVACARPAAVQRAARVLAPGLRDAPCAAVRHYSQALLLVLYGIEARPTRSVLRCARGVRGKRGVSVTISVCDRKFQ
jgi:hypothetical protein